QNDPAQPPPHLSPIRTYTRNPNRTVVTFPSSDPHPSNPPIPPVHPDHSMVTRAKAGIHKPNPRYAMTATTHPILSSIEPTCVSQAVKDPLWRQAMSNEFNALIRNGTWELIPSLPSQNLIGCKWVFRIKRHPDGTIDRYKARLVAKGFHQRPGVDFSDTFSPVVKPTTIRIVLHLAVTHGWPIRQLDVNNAFLHGTLLENVYMVQPPGFVDSNHPSYPSMASNRLHGHGNNSTLVAKFIQLLATRFSVKDLGSLHYFLGVEVLPTATGLFLSQQKYIHDLLVNAKMDGAKAVSTPLSTTDSLMLHDGSPLTDPTPYRRLVGGLQYLSLTRPDISFAVNKLSQFMHSPSETHWQALKRLLRYLKGTISFGLHLCRRPSNRLYAFSDADWAGDHDDRKSTTGYVVYLGGNLISWSSRKQRSVSRSSTEAEYRAIAATTSELTWIQSLLRELGIPLPTPPVVSCDNIGAMFYCANPVLHSRMKHIEIDFQFVRDRVTRGLL
ncbi:transposable element gene, partial [Prunus dulcis]